MYFLQGEYHASKYKKKKKILTIGVTVQTENVW